MFLSILDKKRRTISNKLGSLKDGFYLAGGTALVLQIGHRTSLSFDFYTQKEFYSRTIRENFDKEFKNVVLREFTWYNPIRLVESPLPPLIRGESKGGFNIYQENLGRTKNVQEVFIGENTLGLSVNNVQPSFFKYSYPLIKPLQK